MAAILTTKLKNDSARLFYQDILNNEFYFMISSIATETLTRVPAVNSQFSKNDFKENVIFGKKVFSSDIKFMIKYYPWQSDSVYTQYDDKVDLQDVNFYSVVGPTNNDSGDYRIYKCLSNNNGAKSITPPNFNPTTIEQIYRTPDGYVWKYMYFLTEKEFEAYNAVGYIPLSENFDINPDLAGDTDNIITGSAISDIFVTNFIDNAGYPYVENGIIDGPPGDDSSLLLRSDFLNEIQNYYSGMTIYVESNNVAYTYVINSYTWDTLTNRGTVKVIGNPSADGILAAAKFKILPTIKITGDGEGAKAIPRVLDGTITNIEVLNTGKNYNNAVASVVDTAFDFNPEDLNSTDVRAKLRPILSPIGYHNFNLIDELHCRHILLYAYITESNNNKIGKTNTFSHIGVIKNPIFAEDPETYSTASPDIFDNRIAIITDEYSKAIVNSVVTQRDLNGNIVFSAVVHEVNPSANTIYLSSYMGPYINTSNDDTSLDFTKNLFNETGQIIKINTPVTSNVIKSRYIQRSGTVYFMQDFAPLERAETSREEYKLVLEF